MAKENSTRALSRARELRNKGRESSEVEKGNKVMLRTGRIRPTI